MVFFSYFRQKPQILIIFAYMAHFIGAQAMDAGIQKSSANPMARDLIIIIDDKDRQAIDATQALFFQALISQVAPILISGELWRNFARARFDFNQNRKISGSVENIMFDIYLNIQTSTNRWFEQLGNDPKKIAEMINNAAGPGSLLDLNLTKVEKMFGTQSPQYSKLEQAFSAYAIPFDGSEWDIYDYKHAYYLLIPRSYSEKVSKNATIDLKKINYQTITASESPINNTTALLGFKTNEFVKLSVTDVYDLPGRLDIKEDVRSLDLLSHLFIQKNNITPQQDDQGNLTANYPFVWYFLLLGHGSFSMPAEYQASAATTKENLDYLHNLILSEIGHSPATERKFKTSIDQRQRLFDLINIFKPYIAGMPSHDFSNVLDFLNDSITTSFLTYFSCYAGARNLLFPYLNYFGAPKKLNYTIVTGTQDDVFTLALGGHIFNPFEKKNYVTKDNIKFSIDGNHALFIPFAGKHNLLSFFQALHNEQRPQPLTKIIEYVHQTKIPHIDTSSASIVKTPATYFAPVIRLPYGEAFYVHSFEKNFVHISRVTTSIAAAKTPPGFEINGKQKVGIMLNTYYVPTTIRFINELPYTSASSIYTPTLPAGISGYYVGEINTGSIANLNNVTNLLLQNALDNLKRKSLDQNPTPKVFICDKITTNIPGLKNEGPFPYENVLIFNRLILPAEISNAISKYINQDEEIVSATGVLYTLLYNNTRDANFSGFVIIRNKKTFQERIQLFKDFDLKNEMLQAYLKLFTDYKKALTDKAEKEGLTLIDVKPIQEIKLKKNEKSND